MNRSTMLRVAAFGGILALAACQQDQDPTGPDPLAPATAFSQAGGLAEPGLDRAALARSIPGFGGVFWDSDGQLTVALRDVAARPQAEQALAAFLRGRGLGLQQLRVRTADYEYQSLEGWFGRVWPDAFGVPGVVMADLNETRNRVVIGVSDGGAAAQVRSIAARLGVPAEAIVVEEVEPIRQLATLRDRADFIVGGLQINFPGYLCTLGFNALGGGEESFITNSHCTNTQGGTEGTPYYQPTSSVDPTVIGTEVNDPNYFTGGICPFRSRCRYSDAARVRQEPGRSFTRGRIMKPQNTSGSLDIVGQFTITDEFQQSAPGNNCALEGTIVNKVGRTTGWSRGAIVNSCVHVGVSGTDIVQLYQNIVQAAVNSGDSGSPVFQITTGDNVRLHGILWGGGSSTFVFSPLANIEYELGDLTVTGSGSPPPPPPPTGGEIHVGDLDTSVNVKGRSGKWSAALTVHVHDENEGAVAGASVTVQLGGAASGNLTGTTNSSGAVTLDTGNLSGSGTSVTFMVSSVSLTGSTYVPADNHDTDGGTDGTTATASR